MGYELIYNIERGRGYLHEVRRFVFFSADCAFYLFAQYLSKRQNPRNEKKRFGVSSSKSNSKHVCTIVGVLPRSETFCIFSADCAFFLLLRAF